MATAEKKNIESPDKARTFDVQGYAELTVRCA
jgi:hypothetical protein